jgi:hypothetical protein
VAYTSADHILTKNVDLFDKLHQRRMRLRLIEFVSADSCSTYQINMFEDTEEMLSLYQAMDRMKDRYGFDAVMRCAGATFKPNNRNFETQIITQCTSTVILSSLRYGTIPLPNSYRLLPVMLRQWHWNQSR